MKATKLIAAGTIAFAAAACAGGSPTLADSDAEPPLIPIAPPTDTTGFVPMSPP